MKNLFLLVVYLISNVGHSQNESKNNLSLYIGKPWFNDKSPYNQNNLNLGLSYEREILPSFVTGLDIQFARSGYTPSFYGNLTRMSEEAIAQNNFELPESWGTVKVFSIVPKIGYKFIDKDGYFIIVQGGVGFFSDNSTIGGIRSFTFNTSTGDLESHQSSVLTTSLTGLALNLELKTQFKINKDYYLGPRFTFFSPQYNDTTVNQAATLSTNMSISLNLSKSF